MILAVFIDFLGSRGRKQEKSWNKLSDLRLISIYKETEDLDIISHLMHRYQGLIIARTLHYLKEEEQTKDFVSQLYLMLSTKLKTAEIVKFRPWLRQTILNALIDQGRRANYFAQYIRTQEEEVIELDQELALEVDAEILAISIEKLELLPRLYIMQRFFLGKPNREICQEFDLTMNDIRSARRRAFQVLRQELGAHFTNYFIE